MKALVTGATGFIGRHLVEALLERGHTVHAVARTQRRAATLAGTRARVLVADLADEGDIAGLAQDMDVVFHLASVIRASDEAFERVDVQGTERLLREAERAGVRRLVFTSTISAYPLAQQADGAVIDENCALDATGLLNNYARSKMRAERHVLEAHKRGSLEGVVVRLGWTCGSGAAVLPNLVCQVMSPKLLVVFGDGGVPLPLVYIDNAVDALIRAATTEGVGGESFNVVDDDDVLTQQQYVELYQQGTGRKATVLKVPKMTYYMLATVSEIVAAARGKSPDTTRYRVRARLRRVRWDCSKARRVLQWEPHVPLRAGLLRTFQAHAHGAAEQPGVIT